MTAQSHILIVDDESDIRSLLKDILEDEGYVVYEAAHSMEADHIMANKGAIIDLIILDIWLKNSEKDGIELLESFKTEQPDIPVLMISGHGNIETAVQTTKLGAFDFVEKPFKADRLLLSIRNALQLSTLQKENTNLKNKTVYSGFNDLIAKAEATQRLKREVEKIAPTDSRVLITGAPGSGKSMLARYIHKLSNRADQSFISLNCAVLEPQLVQAELFGDPDKGTKGVIEQVNGGTLFLEEVADLPLETQGKLLKILQDQKYRPIGSDEDMPLNIRIITSTDRNLEQLMREGTFRQDLYYRLSVVPLHMPPLSKRYEDIEELIVQLSAELANSNIPVKPLSPKAIDTLKRHTWPGNIRELKNTLERAMIMCASDKRIIETNDLPESVTNVKSGPAHANTQSVAVSLPLREARETFEHEYLKAQLERFSWNITKTAEFIGMERTALHRKMKSLNLSEQNTEATKKAS